MLRKSLILLSLALLPLLLVSQESKENADFKLALNLYNDGFYDLALEQFRQFVSFYPNTQQGIEARYYLGLSQFALERSDEARLTFQNFALSYTDHPRAPEAWQKVAESYLREGNKKEAASAYERIRTFHPRSRLASEALERSARLFDEIGDAENAIRILRILTQEYSSAGLYAANLRLAELYAERDQPDAAMTEVRKVIEGSQEARFRGPALYLQARLMLRRGRSPEARATLLDIQKNYKTSPAYHDALFALADLSMAEGDLTQAMQAWREISTDSKASSTLRQRASYELAQALQSSMDIEGAFDAYQQALVLQGPLSASASYRAGRIKEMSGDTVTAARLYADAAADTTPTPDRLDRLIGGVRAGRWTHRADLVRTNAEQIIRQFESDEAVPRVLLLWADDELHVQSDAERAEELYRRALRHSRGGHTEDGALLGIARCLAKQGYPERAVEAYDDLLQRFPASTIRGDAVAERDLLQTYTLKDRDSGTEQLAFLLGDVIGEQQASTLAFRLAEISFLQLKNFTLARDQYRRALDGGLPAENRPVALFHLGQSLVSLYASPTGLRQATQRTDAIDAFETLIREHPGHPLVREAFVEIVHLTAADANDISRLEALAVRADSLRLDGPTALRVKKVLADRAAHLGAAARALEWYGEAFQGSREASDRGELLYRSGYLLSRSGAADTATGLLSAGFFDNGPHPFVAQAGLELALLQARKGNAEAVKAISDRLTGSFGYAVDARELLLRTAEAQQAAGRPRESLLSFSAYRAAVESDPFRPQLVPTAVVVSMARSARDAGGSARALQLFGEVIARGAEPDILLESWYAVAALSESHGDLARASSAMNEASRIAASGGGDVTGVSLQSADLLFRTEQYQQALDKYRNVQAQTKSDSLRTALEARIIVCYFRLNNLAEADKRATAFVRANPRAAREAATFEFERGMHHTRQGRPDQARKRFDLIVRDYPQDPLVPEALYWLGRLYELGEQPDSAGMVYDSLLRRYPDADIVPRVELSLGNVYYALERWDEAVRLYRRILDDRKRAPDLVQFAMNNLILTYKELTLYDGALQLTREYITLFPDDPDLINKRIDIGVLYQKLGYYEQSVVHLQDLLLTAPSEYEAELRYYIGEAYYYKAEYQQAILEFLKVPYLVARQGPIDWISTSYYMAGQSYEKLSRFDQAIAMYQQIIDRKGIDAQFKTAAQREIDRVKALVGQRD